AQPAERHNSRRSPFAGSHGSGETWLVYHIRKFPSARMGRFTLAEIRAGTQSSGCRTRFVGLASCEINLCCRQRQRGRTLWPFLRRPLLLLLQTVGSQTRWVRRPLESV